jgi:TRAP-type mannitol/chloroaromatic compound transport system permease large subunit
MNIGSGKYKNELIEKIILSYHKGLCVQDGITTQLFQSVIKKLKSIETIVTINKQSYFGDPGEITIKFPPLYFRNKHLRFIIDALNWSVPDKWNIRSSHFDEPAGKAIFYLVSVMD